MIVDDGSQDGTRERLSRKNMRRYSGRIARQMLVDNSVSINTVMVRRECFDSMGGFSDRYGVADDYGSVLKPLEIRWGLARFYCRKARYFAATGRAATAWGAVVRALRFSPLDSAVWRSVYRVIFPRH